MKAARQYAQRAKKMAYEVMIESLRLQNAVTLNIPANHDILVRVNLLAKKADDLALAAEQAADSAEQAANDQDRRQFTDQAKQAGEEVAQAAREIEAAVKQAEKNAQLNFPDSAESSDNPDNDVPTQAKKPNGAWKRIIIILLILACGALLWWWLKTTNQQSKADKAVATKNEAKLVTCLEGLDKTLQSGVKLSKEDADRIDLVADSANRIGNRVDELAVMARQTSDTLKMLIANGVPVAKGKKSMTVAGHRKTLLGGKVTASTTIIEPAKPTLEGLSSQVKGLVAREEIKDRVALRALGMSPEQAERALHDGNYRCEITAWKNALDKAANSASAQSVNELGGRFTKLEDRVRTQEVEITNLRGETIKVTQRVESVDNLLGGSIQRLKTVGHFGSPKKALRGVCLDRPDHQE